MSLGFDGLDLSKLGFIKKKTELITSSLSKMERVCYNLQVRGGEYGCSKIPLSITESNNEDQMPN
ncbi:hypothetical protein DSO57_1000955 [Entomophthora muscae]|uniref:Uncharacterized protein n=1 Tax=Entomophthora muscae TaxID=34485 RepID=A0ACC2UHX4_9FUNG|nr:hypothetical protein DSO57_1000955 [Entomophthora muscae]